MIDELSPRLSRFTDATGIPTTKDEALAGAHTKMLCGTLRREEAAALIQLRTGMSRLNGYLHGIRATDSRPLSMLHRNGDPQPFSLQMSEMGQLPTGLTVPDVGQQKESFLLPRRKDMSGPS